MHKMMGWHEYTSSSSALNYNLLIYYGVNFTKYFRAAALVDKAMATMPFEYTYLHSTSTFINRIIDYSEWISKVPFPFGRKFC